MTIDVNTATVTGAGDPDDGSLRDPVYMEFL
jgi:hypothetical protein